MRVSILVGLVVAGVLALTVAAGAVIRPNVGIHGVRFGEGPAAIERALGKPTRIGRCFQQDSRKRCTDAYVYRTFEVGVYQGAAILFYTTAKAEKTAQGIGPGSTLAAVKRVYRSCTVNDCEVSAGKMHTLFGFQGTKRVVAVYMWRESPGLGCFPGGC